MKYIDVEVNKDYYGYYTRFKQLIAGTIVKLSEDIVKPLLARDIIKIHIKPEVQEIVNSVVDNLEPKQTEKKTKESKK